MQSPYKKVRYEARIASGVICERIHDITNKWLNLKKKSLSSQEIINFISDQENLEPITVSAFARFSDNEDIRREAYYANLRIMEGMYNIQEEWDKVKNENPHLNSEEIILQIAENLDLEPTSIILIGRSISNKEIAQEMQKLQGYFLMRSHNLTERWLKLKNKGPHISLEEIVQRLAKEDDISPLSIANYARNSKNEIVKKEARNAFGILSEKSHKITVRWKEIKNKNKDALPQDIAETIAKELSLSPISVGEYGRWSEDVIVKQEAIRAKNVLLPKITNVTNEWLQLIKTNKNKSTFDIVEELSLKMRKSPITIAGYARFSNNKLVSKGAYEISLALIESLHNIAKNWLDLKKINPQMPPNEIAELISEKLLIKPISVAAYGKSSNNQYVKKEATYAYGILYEKKYDFTEKWLRIKREHPAFSPIEIVEQISKIVSLAPSTIAFYTQFSKNVIVKREGNIVKHRLNLSTG